MQIVLQIHSGGLRDRRTWLGDGQSLRVGRMMDADSVVTDDATLSGLHFLLRCDSGKCLLRDLGSSNGTYVNGAKITETVLKDAILPLVEHGLPLLARGLEWVADVLPRAIQKHGGITADALAKAAQETDIPEGGTMQGYGVKFHPPGHAMAGQNARAFAAVFQVQDGRFKHVFPPVVASGAPILPLPASSPFAAQ